MTGIIMLIAVMAAAVIGIYFIVTEIIKVFIKNTVPTTVIIELRGKKSCAGSVEDKVRSALSANPDAEIVIVNRCVCGETERILQRLADDYKRVHILDAPLSCRDKS